MMKKEAYVWLAVAAALGFLMFKWTCQPDRFLQNENADLKAELSRLRSNFTELCVERQEFECAVDEHAMKNIIDHLQQQGIDHVFMEPKEGVSPLPESWDDGAHPHD